MKTVITLAWAYVNTNDHFSERQLIRKKEVGNRGYPALRDLELSETGKNDKEVEKKRSYS